jgi:hypothetical protein
MGWWGGSGGMRWWLGRGRGRWPWRCWGVSLPSCIMDYGNGRWPSSVIMADLSYELKLNTYELWRRRGQTLGSALSLDRGRTAHSNLLWMFCLLIFTAILLYLEPPSHHCLNHQRIAIEGRDRPTTAACTHKTSCFRAEHAA